MKAALRDAFLRMLRPMGFLVFGTVFFSVLAQLLPKGLPQIVCFATGQALMAVLHLLTDLKKKPEDAVQTPGLPPAAARPQL